MKNFSPILVHACFERWWRLIFGAVEAAARLF